MYFKELEKVLGQQLDRNKSLKEENERLKSKLKIIEGLLSSYYDLVKIYNYYFFYMRAVFPKLVKQVETWIEKGFGNTASPSTSMI